MCVLFFVVFVTIYSNRDDTYVDARAGGEGGCGAED